MTVSLSKGHAGAHLYNIYLVIIYFVFIYYYLNMYLLCIYLLFIYVFILLFIYYDFVCIPYNNYGVGVEGVGWGRWGELDRGGGGGISRQILSFWSNLG